MPCAARPKAASGRVRLGTSTGVVVDLLPQVLEALEAHHAGIDVEVSILGSNEAMSRLAAGTLDIGLVAMPQPPLRDLVVTHWRSQPMMAFVPQRWKAPKRATPQWLASQPLIFNDATTHMYRLTMEWFAAAGHSPRARIELNYDAAIRSLVAAGYGAALLPLQQTADAPLNERMQILPLEPAARAPARHRAPAARRRSTARPKACCRSWRASARPRLQRGFWKPPSIQAAALSALSLKPGATRASPSCAPNSSCARSSACGLSSSGTICSETRMRSEPAPTLTLLLSCACSCCSCRRSTSDGGLHQRVEGGRVERLGVLLVAAHGPRADQRGLGVAMARHRDGPAVVVFVLDDARGPALVAPEGGFLNEGLVWFCHGGAFARSKNGKAGARDEQLERLHAEQRIAGGIERRRPDAQRELVGHHGDDAAADAALAGQADREGDVAGGIVGAAGQHQRVDAARLALGRDLRLAVAAGARRRGTGSRPRAPAARSSCGSRTGGSTCRARSSTSLSSLPKLFMKLASA